MAYVSELITETLDTVIKLVFINQPPDISQLKTIQLLQDSMVSLYTSTLLYLGLANIYFNRGSWGRAGMSLAGAENSEIIRSLASVKTQEQRVKDHYEGVFRESKLWKSKIGSEIG